MIYKYQHCSGLTKVHIGNSVTSIGNHAFYYCRNLKEIRVPNSVHLIGNSAFRDCSGLTNVHIGNSVTSIGNHAFYYCRNLKEIRVPNSVHLIGECAFDGCDSLQTVYLGTELDDLGQYAFNCRNLSAIYNASQRPTAIEATVFQNVNKYTCWLYVPEGFEQIYWANTDWNLFQHIGTWDPSVLDVIPSDVTGDGSIDISDVNAVINMMLGKSEQTTAGDVTGDGTVDIADVNAVINAMLGKQ